MRDAAVVRTSRVQNKSLTPIGMPSSGPAVPSASRASAAFAMARALCGVSSTNALSARARSTAAICASANSAAEIFLLRSRSRACAIVSSISSVIRPGCRTRTRTAWLSPPFAPCGMKSCRPALQTERSLPALAVAWRADHPRCTHRASRPWRSARAVASGSRVRLLRRPYTLTVNPSGDGAPGRADDTCHKIAIQRSFNHFWNKEKAVLRRRRIAQDLLGNVAISDDIRPLLHRHRRDRGHWVDIGDIDRRQLLDKRENRVQLRLQMGDLVFGNGNAGQMRNAAHGLGVHGHG